MPGFQCNTIICLFILCLLLSSFLGLPLRQFPSLLHNRMEIIISIDEKFSWSYLFCNSPNAIHGCVLHTYILNCFNPCTHFPFTKLSQLFTQTEQSISWAQVNSAWSIGWWFSWSSSVTDTVFKEFFLAHSYCTPASHLATHHSSFFAFCVCLNAYDALCHSCLLCSLLRSCCCSPVCKWKLAIFSLPYAFQICGQKGGDLSQNKTC